MLQSKKYFRISSPGFTIIELLVVIAIIGLIATFSFIIFSNAYRQSRDARRVSDIMKIQQALAQYRRDEGHYPDSLITGESLVSTTTGAVYMDIIPSNPEPRAENDCADSDYVYIKNSGFDSYILHFCLSSRVSNIPAGDNIATPSGISKSLSVVDGLMSSWNFDEGAGLSAYDGGQKKTHVSTTFEVWASDTEVGNYLFFPDSWIQTSDHFDFDFNKSFSVSVWVKPDGMNSENAIVSNYTVRRPGGWDLELYAGVPRVNLYGSTNLSGSLSAPDLRVGSSWHHVLATIETNYNKSSTSAETIIKTFIDGSLAETVDGTWAPGYTDISTNFKIGGHYTIPVFYGGISNLKIYNRALSDAEARLIYDLGK